MNNNELINSKNKNINNITKMILLSKNKKKYFNIVDVIYVSHNSKFIFINSYDGINWVFSISYDLLPSLSQLKEIKINNSKIIFASKNNITKDNVLQEKNTYDNFSIIISFIKDKYIISTSKNISDFDTLKFL